MSTVSAVSSTTTSADGTDTITGAGSKTLSQNDFMQLLVTQMTSQDPLNPQTDTQMAANMAQFTALQQSNTMSANIAEMLVQQQIVQASNMLGGTVTLQGDNNTITSGVVQSVQLDGGTPKIVVNNTAYDLSQVLSIAPTISTAAQVQNSTATTVIPNTIASQSAY